VEGADVRHQTDDLHGGEAQRQATGSWTARRTDGQIAGYNVVRTAHYSASTFRCAKCGGKVPSTSVDTCLTRYYDNRCQTVQWTDRQTVGRNIMVTTHNSTSTPRRATCGRSVLSTSVDACLTRYYDNRCQTVQWTDRQTASYQIPCTLISYE